MSKSTGAGGILIVIAGALIFGVLMALRGDASSFLIRAAIAALAFAVGAAALVLSMRRFG